MPPRRELPGFYFDETKNRYFPLSSKPKAVPPTSIAPSNNAAKRRRLDSQAVSGSDHTQSSNVDLKSRLADSEDSHARTWRAIRDLQMMSPSSSGRRLKAWRDIHRSQMEATTSCEMYRVYSVSQSAITAYKTIEYAGRVHSFAGDSRGWLHSFNTLSSSYHLIPPSHKSSMWSPEFNLGSKISSISASGSLCVATSFGPASKVLLNDFTTNRVIVMTPDHTSVHDVWTSHLRGRTLALGMRRRAVLVPDIVNRPIFCELDTKSDVMSVHQEENLVYTGARNGSIRRFDTRQPSFESEVMLENRFMHMKTTQRPANSIVYMSVVNESQLLVSAIDGTIELHDLRFATGSNPSMSLEGNVNSYKHDLPHTITPSEDYLFAAGLDNRIRGWSLHTGEALIPPPTSLSSLSTPITSGSHNSSLLGRPNEPDDDYSKPNPLNPFNSRFDEPLTALQALSLPTPSPSLSSEQDPYPGPDQADDREGEEISKAHYPGDIYLQATSGNTVYSFGLGQRALSRVERTSIYG